MQTDDSASAPAIPKARFTFGLRSLLITMALGGLLLAYVVYPLHQWWRQSAAIPVLKAHGAEFPIYNSWDAEKPEHRWCKAVTLRDGLSKDPQFLAALKAMPWLEQLIINPSRVRLAQDELQFVGELTHLKQLEIHGGQKLLDLDLTPLQNLKRLEELQLFRFKIDGQVIAKLHTLPALKRLSLIFCEDFSLEAARELGQLNNLESLSLMSSEIASAHLKELTNLTQLQHLSLTYTKVDDEGMPVISNFKKLKSLGLQECPLTDEGLKSIASLYQLENLQLNGTKLTDDGMINLQGLTKLRSLSLGNTQIRGYGLKHLSRITDLQQLFLYQTDLAPETIIELSRFPKLQMLTITGPNFGDEHMRFLPQLASIRQLTLGGGQLTDVGLLCLDRIPYQVLVDIRAKNATEEGMRKARSNGGYTFSNR